MPSEPELSESKEVIANNEQYPDEYAKEFDHTNKSISMDIDHFKGLLTKASEGKSTDEEAEKLFKICDGNADGKLTRNELKDAYEWFRPIVNPVAALINVDVQYDFINGSLALPDAEAVIPVIMKLMEEPQSHFHLIVFSVDWHPENHISFIDNVKTRKLDPSSKIQNPEEVQQFDTVVFDTRHGPMEQKMWPRHCVQKTHGAEIHHDLEERMKQLEQNGPKVVRVEKGGIDDIESYTAFGAPEYNAPTILKKELEKERITEVYLTGLALDVCVANTGKDALDHNYTVSMVEDAQRGVTPESVEEAKKELESKGARYVQSTEVLNKTGITLEDRMATFRRKLGKEIVTEQQKQ